MPRKNTQREKQAGLKRVSFFIPGEVWHDLKFLSKKLRLPMSLVLRKGVERAVVYYEEYAEEISANKV